MINFKNIETKLDKVISMSLEIWLKRHMGLEEGHDLSDINNNDLSYSKEEKTIYSYLNNLKDEELHDILSTMYIHRDGYEGINGNTDDIIDKCMDLLNTDNKTFLNK